MRARWESAKPRLQYWEREELEYRSIEMRNRQNTHVAPVLPKRAPSEGPRSMAAIGATWVPCRDETETAQKEGEREKEAARQPFLLAERAR